MYIAVFNDPQALIKTDNHNLYLGDNHVITVSAYIEVKMYPMYAPQNCLHFVVSDEIYCKVFWCPYTYTSHVLECISISVSISFWMLGPPTFTSYLGILKSLLL